MVLFSEVLTSLGIPVSHSLVRGLSLLTLGHPLLGFYWNFCCCFFDRVWHKTLIYKLPFFGFYPSLCSFISNFLSDCSIAAVIDGHCSSPKPMNSGVQMDFVLSPTLFLLFINDLPFLTHCLIHSYADDSTLHFTFFSKRLSQKQINDSRETPQNA